MPLPFATLFRKTALCPTSEALLTYQRASLVPYDAHISRHLDSCDFCRAELQLLTRYRCDVEEYSLAEMPAQLRRLAEDLLHHTTVSFTAFAELADNSHVSH